jgi:signal transduction histidine kinase
VVRAEHFYLVEDLGANLEIGLDLEKYRQEGMRSVLGVCLRAWGDQVGVVVYASRASRHFGPPNLAFVLSVSDVVAVAIENARMYDEMRQAMRLHEEFMAAVAHELRSPITVIQGRAQRTLKLDAREEIARTGIEQILHASGRINHIVDDLIAVLKFHPGRTTLHREVVDLRLVVRHLVEETARTTEHYHFSVRAPEPLLVDADQALIGEVVTRLLENAMRYAPDGGQIDVDAHAEEGRAIVSVTDHGLGISLERQRHVFEPFYELIPAGAPGYVGLVSLGLYLSKQIVEAHGGRIWFESTPGQGSTFSFSLPLAATGSPTQR